MALNDCCRCVKFFFILLNLLITIIGLVVLGCALWLFFDTFYYLQIAQTNDEYYRGTYLLMGVGILMTVVGFLGCVGACRESPCMLGTFFTLVLLIFVAEVASIVWIHMNRETLRNELRKSIAAAVREDYGKVLPRTEALDVIQSQLKCCGGTGPRDWAKSYYNNGDGNKSGLELGIQGIASAVGVYKVPASCCNVQPDDPRCEAAQQVQLAGQLTDVISQEGCGDQLLQFLQDHTWVVVGIVASVMVIEVLALMIALSLCITVMRAEQEYKA
ncbi:CD82 antigen-like [Pollicipes pollicipes]|uniref:CD82 antigen-like n=1 Tax=Pollicipes pollicipes TaxID=41117 RepID=UPI0018855824|nr:CD82 antigen-like [Pollicipes pollicipes]